MIRHITAATAMALVLGACASVYDTETAETEAAATEAVETAVAETVEEVAPVVEGPHAPMETMMHPEHGEMKADMKPKALTLEAVLAMQPDEVKARYDVRHPAETLALFGIEPGMTVVEALPGGGWYSKILLPYLGPEGELIGGQYPADLWARFGFGDEFATSRVERDAKWAETASEWTSDATASVSNTYLTSFEGVEDGSVDAVLFIRALHNLNRFSAETGYMDDVIASSLRALKPGGVIGVVQHRAPAANPDEWAVGSAGYLKQQAVIDMFTAGGFELEATSELNANPKDMPTAEDIVWRLPPTYNGSEEGSPERAAVDAIGESDRMTLVFRKPA